MVCVVSRTERCCLLQIVERHGVVVELRIIERCEIIGLRRLGVDAYAMVQQVEGGVKVARVLLSHGLKEEIVVASAVVAREAIGKGAGITLLLYLKNGGLFVLVVVLHERQVACQRRSEDQGHDQGHKDEGCMVEMDMSHCRLCYGVHFTPVWP